MTPEQVAKLHQAIELALGPGRCRYVDDGKPCCIIAQLAALEGVTVDILTTWNNMLPVGLVLQQLNPPELRSYPAGLLEDLQRIWDGKDGGLDTTCRLRMRMHREVDPQYRDAAGL